MTIMLLLVACAAGLACAVQSSKPEGGSSDLRDVCQRTLDSEWVEETESLLKLEKEEANRPKK